MVEKVSNKTRWFYSTVWDVDYDFDKLVEGNQVRYVVRGHIERCPNVENKTPHRHCLIYTNNPYSICDRSFGTIAKMMKMAKHPWIKDAKGTEKEIISYSCKETGAPPDCYGDRPAQGMRKDIDVVIQELKDGKITTDEIALEYPILYHQYGRTFEKIQDILMRKVWRKEMTKGLWIHGPTGTGKSHYAYHDYTPEKIYPYPNDGGWWDGYKQQECVVINEFRGGIQYSELLDLCDKWPKSVRRRGREPLPFTSKLIIITSSLSPEEAYNNLSQNDSLKQLYDRFEVKQLKGKSKRGSAPSKLADLGPPIWTAQK